MLTSKNISLLIPTYNAEHHLPNLIADARAQTAPFAEILVYDDKSTDRTVEVAKALGVDRILPAEENRGASYARNRLIDACGSEWIHFHDADDRLDARYNELVLQASPEPDEVVLCGLKTYDATTQTFGR
jgi:glycosyltransferase involved in cell wall biosynthesis